MVTTNVYWVVTAKPLRGARGIKTGLATIWGDLQLTYSLHTKPSLHVTIFSVINYNYIISYMHNMHIKYVCTYLIYMHYNN